ncbi:hypothetical protein MKX01_038129 [Papaver californicum]|nr:hypothetical protein MKX01_038129 [Papaver californicum]
MAEPEGDEWDIWNDDGFVCKRRRRGRSKINTPADHIATMDQLKKKNKKRKKMILMKLRDEYKREIQEWEKLSNILSTLNQEKTQSQKSSSSVMDSAMTKSYIFSDDFVCQNLFIDELLLQAEAQEAIILNLSNLCDAAEAKIILDKQQFMQSMMNIPLLGSPRSILVSLSD